MTSYEEMRQHYLELYYEHLFKHVDDMDSWYDVSSINKPDGIFECVEHFRKFNEEIK